MQNDKLVLDATCGGRMMWFDRRNPLAFFIDSREVEPTMVGKGRAARKFEVTPDEVMDFRNLRFDDETFHLVVFDPPHLKRAGPQSYMAKKYGKLDPNTWQKDLHDGFAECWRVTKINGVIIFKWNEYQIKTSDVIKAIGVDPLFGHTTNSKSTTKWLCFIKTGVNYE